MSFVDENDDEPEHEEMRRVREACETLNEHFDAVHIFASVHEAGQEDGTVNVSYGLGNWFARYGQIREWLVKTDERSREHVRYEE